MASGPGGRAEEQPPALPVKQHRSPSFRSSGGECDGAAGLQRQSSLCNDVFPEPTDCHAAQCPIHQRYDPARHQVRFFSEDTPPPVPKKRLARTLSLPGAPPLSPMSPLQRRPQNFDNPLYMLAPVPDNCFHEEPEVFQHPPPSPSTLSRLSFDTPDEHLPHLFSGFDDQALVFQGIQHRHLLSLRGMAQRLDAGILLQREAVQRDAGSYQPQDFLLCEGSKPKQIGDALYFSLRSPKFPGRLLGLRVHRQTDEAHAHKHQPPHVNVREVVAHFQGIDAQTNDSGASQPQDALYSNRMACTAATPPAGGSAGHDTDHAEVDLQYFLTTGHSLSVERDLPHATLEDFVQDGASLQTAESCLDYDRRFCVLLLQILIGSQHLYNAGSSVAELRPREIFLSWQQSGRGRDALEKSGSKEDAENNRKLQMLWRTHGAPRVVLLPSARAASKPLVYIKSQIIALIQYGLHPQEISTSHASGPIFPQSSYRAGLLYLVSLLQSESIGLQTADMATMLQVLLWGPRVPLSDRRRPLTATVHGWLTVKRALLMMQLAESGLVRDRARSAPGWEERMCLRYLSLTEAEEVVSAASKLWITVNMNL